MRKTCGECEHGIEVRDSNAIGRNNLACFLGPPQAVIVSIHGQQQMTFVRPIVQPMDPCCSAFQPKQDEVKINVN